MFRPTTARIRRLPRRLSTLLALAAVGLAGGGAVLLAGPAERLTLAASRPPPDRSRAAATDTSRSHVRTPLAPATRVGSLRRLVQPDLSVVLPRTASTRAVRALAHAPGVAAVTVLDVARVRTPEGVLRVAAVDPAEFRGFTPRLSAVSNRLWQSVAEGEVTLAFSRGQRFSGRLGQPLPMARSRTTNVRVGALATLGVPGVDAVVSHAVGRQLGLAARREVLVSAPRMSLPDLRYLVTQTLGDATTQTLRPVAVDQSRVSGYAASVIPAAYLRLYQAAARTCTGLPWTVLAAIGAVETGHGADTSVSSAGARGPMQFMPGTWAMFGIDANHDGRANILDPVDAVYSAARYLCASGGGRGGQALYDAIFAYNHADWYVREVVALALRYQ